MDEYVDRFDNKESEEKEMRPRLQKYFEWYFEKEGEFTTGEERRFHPSSTGVIIRPRAA